jgi:Protein of unknown function (DUF2742)
MAVVNMPPDKREAPTGKIGATPEASTRQVDSYSITRAIGSRQAAWWEVHEYVAPTLAAAGTWPMVGTLEWCALDDTDPVKLAAVFDAAQHWALHVELSQEARCEASKAISAAEDWSAVSQRIKARNDFYAEQPWMKRVSA